MKSNDMDCKYCVENADVKVKLPFLLQVVKPLR